MRMVCHLDETSAMARNAFEVVRKCYSAEAIIPQVELLLK